jgi:crotonobetainyl-CoA:carnitine CoA-transferase CaiB-like acyl-CoA transferase
VSGQGGATSDDPTGTVPGYGLFDTADGGQIAFGVVNEQHFWSALCAALELDDDLAVLDFAERTRRGDELQAAVATATRVRARDELVEALTGAGVPVAPVLDRAAMVATAPFPNFPIRLSDPPKAGRVPRLNEHKGEGFGPRV